VHSYGDNPSPLAYLSRQVTDVDTSNLCVSKAREREKLKIRLKFQISGFSRQKHFCNQKFRIFVFATKFFEYIFFSSNMSSIFLSFNPSLFCRQSRKTLARHSA
jgi:hypothetical protein